MVLGSKKNIYSPEQYIQNTMPALAPLQRLLDSSHHQQEGLSSLLFIEIHAPEIHDTNNYQEFLAGLEHDWIVGYNMNAHYLPSMEFNSQPYGFHGYVGRRYVNHVNFMKYDGTLTGISEDDYRAKRGVVLFLQNTPENITLVNFVADNFIEFLNTQRIGYNKISYHKKT